MSADWRPLVTTLSAKFFERNHRHTVNWVDERLENQIVNGKVTNMETLDRLLELAKEYPLEITLSSGAKHRIPHPDYIHGLPKRKEFIYYPDKGEYYSIEINPAHVTQVKRVGRKHRVSPF